jgi:hypothetical protein
MSIPYSCDHDDLYTTVKGFSNVVRYLEFRLEYEDQNQQQENIQQMLDDSLQESF